MNRGEAIELILESEYCKIHPLFVSNIGYCSRELYSLHDSTENFYMLGSMGLASSIGLGLSLTRRDREILVLDGDASILMNLGSLSTIGNYAPRNFHLLILDNEVHGSTGNQKNNTGLGTSLAVVAKGAGIKSSSLIKTKSGLEKLFSNRENSIPSVVIIKCKAGNLDVPIVDLREPVIKERFMKSLGNYSSRKRR